MKKSIIAACGINCSTCYVYLRDKKNCTGCNSENINKPAHCKKCSIKNCEYLINTKSKFCYECKKYPCTRLKQLDKRYKTNYHFSLLENLANIKSLGINYFLEIEKTKWICSNCGEKISVHLENCLKCNNKIR